MKRILLSVILSAMILSACGSTAPDIVGETETVTSASETEKITDISTETEASEAEMSAGSENVFTETVITPDIKIDIPSDLFTEDKDMYVISVYSDNTYKCRNEDWGYLDVETVNELLGKSDYSPEDSEYEQYRLELMERFGVGEDAFAEYDRIECSVDLMCEYFYGDNKKTAAAKTVFGYVMTAANDAGIKLERSDVTGKPCSVLVTYVVNEDLIYLTASYSTDDGWENIIEDDTIEIVY